MNFAGPWVIPIPSFRTPERLLNKVHCLAATFPRASTQWGIAAFLDLLKRETEGPRDFGVPSLQTTPGCVHCAGRLLFANAPTQSLRILAVRRVIEVSKWKF
jgi:hypothetical protein